MNIVHDDQGRRLYKARGADGEVTWVDHDELWRLQRSQQDELRQGQARRRHRVLLTLVGVAALALVLVLSWWRHGPVATLDGATAPLPRLDTGEPDGVPGGSTAATAPGTLEAAPDAGTGEPADAPPPDSIADRLGAAVSEPLAGREAEAAEPPEEAVASPTERVAGAVRAWADAWARQDLDAYLASYSAEFDPSGGLTRAAWTSLRRGRLQAPVSIRVEIEQLEITLPEGGRAQARFVQRYSSPAYSDVVRKSLELIEEDGDWRIVRELAGAPRGADLG